MEPARALATLFYRIAFLVDHEYDYGFESPTRLIDDTDQPLGNLEREGYPPLLRYEPPKDAVRELSKSIPRLGGMSLEAFLHYNNLMAWNEDCKYYYRDTDGGQVDWDWPRTGRINTLLTHISVRGVITGEIKFSTMMDKFQRGRGVAPVTGSEAEAVTDGLVG